MIPNTFKIRTGPAKTDVRDFPFEEEFDLFGETWVIHRRFHGPGYTCSHKETGFKLKGIDRERAVEAKHHAVVLLTENQDKIPAWVARARA